MKYLTISLFILSASLNSFAIDIPSRDGLRGSEKKHFKKQERILRDRGYRFGDNKLAERISDKIKTREICEDYKVDDGVQTGLFGITLRVGIEKKSVFNYDYILNNNREEVNALPPVCRRNFLEAYKNHKAENDDEEDDYCTDRECELVTEANQLYIDNIDALEESFSEADQLVLQRVACEEMEAAAAILRQEEAAAEIKRMLSLVRDVSDCTPLEVGESRVTSKNDRLADYVEQKYAVTNIGNDTYRVDLNINFVPDHVAFQDETSGSAASAAMLERVRGCAEKANSAASDSLGRKLQFNILTPSESAELPEGLRPPEVNIMVRAADAGRQNSRAYNENITCAVVIHEMMHLMGLHDEYPESHIGNYTHKTTGVVTPYYNSNGTFNAEGMALVDANRDDYEAELSYQCRAVPNKSTIMKNTHSFFPQVVPESNICECSNSEGFQRDACQEIFKQDQATKDRYLKLSSSRFEMIPGLNQYCTRATVVSTIQLAKFEDLKYYNLVSDLRRNGRSISFVKNQASLGDDKVVRLFPGARTCSCPEGNEACMNMIEEISQIGADTNKVKSNTCPFPTNVSRSGATEVTDPINQSVFNTPTEESRIPLFENAHVEKVLFPGCDSRGQKYVSCLDGAYSSAGHSCEAVPNFCSDDSWLTDI